MSSEISMANFILAVPHRDANPRRQGVSKRGDASGALQCRINLENLGLTAQSTWVILQRLFPRPEIGLNLLFRKADLGLGLGT